MAPRIRTATFSTTSKVQDQTTEDQTTYLTQEIEDGFQQNK